MLQATRKVNGKVLWANIHLLFWLSFMPFVTGWMGENHFAALPTAVYGGVFLLCAVSYTILQITIVKHDNHENELLAAVIGKDLNGKISIPCYVVAISIAFLNQAVAGVLYAVVAIIWIIPDRRIEEKINE